MELRHLRYFIGVAEEENVSRAALKLHVSQPALSRQIRDLEEELGFLLLERSARSVRLTEAGRAFLIEARAVLQRAEDAVKAARAIATGQRGELHVGYAPSVTARRKQLCRDSDCQDYFDGAFLSAPSCFLWPPARPAFSSFSWSSLLILARSSLSSLWSLLVSYF